MNPKKTRKKKPAGAKSRKKGTPAKDFPVVGIGASAGGIKAVKDLLKHLPSGSRLAIILVLHLKSGHKSILAEIISRQTKLDVGNATDGEQLEPGHIYVISPDKKIAVSGGKLKVTEKKKEEKRPIDYLLKSLAKDQKKRSVAVILSGTGSDGAAGVKEIKKNGGIVFVQDEKTAEYFDMPRSAVETKSVDEILPPSEIAKRLHSLTFHPYISGPADKLEPEEEKEGMIDDIFGLIKRASGIDFSHYKTSTVKRRIARRMAIHRISEYGKYKKYLENHTEEALSLYNDLLISVTSFFREKKCFEALKKKVFPHLLSKRSSDNPVRVWVPGCSTGEEAYSLAIALKEAIRKKNLNIPLQVFGSDLSPRLIEKARSGHYQDDITETVPRHLLRQYFVRKEGGGYKISKEIRSCCIFAVHDLIKDPPLSNMDIVSCRNVLIYFDSVLQRKVLPLLHYSLKPEGFLVLGGSESLGRDGKMFHDVDKKERIFKKKPVERRFVRPLDMEIGRFDRGFTFEGDETEKVREKNMKKKSSDIDAKIDKILLEKYSPAGVLIEPNLDIVQFRGRISPFLEPIPGKASLNLMNMAREGLLSEISDAVKEASGKGSSVRRAGVEYFVNNEHKEVDIEVQPIGRRFLVIFEPSSPGKRKEKKTPKGRSSTVTEVTRLRRELVTVKNQMQAAVEEKEASNEELRAANEEIQSSNEELQSMNEELETAKEELQSTNEELITVNEELQNRNQELSILNNDLNNIYTSISIPIIMVGPDLCIRSFTPDAGKLINIVSTDVGRPIEDIKLKADIPDLHDLLVSVIDDIEPKKRQIQDINGRWYEMNIRPYRTLENKIDGAVIVFSDIDEIKRSEETCQLSESRFRLISELSPDVIARYDKERRLLYLNKRAEDLTGIKRSEFIGKKLEELGIVQNLSQWNSLLNSVFRTAKIQKREIAAETREGKRIFHVQAFPEINRGRGTVESVFTTARDITELKEKQKVLIKEKEHAEKEVKEKEKELDEAKRLSDIGALASIVAHELRNPLSVIRAAMYNLNRKNKNSSLNKHISRVEHSIDDSEWVINNLLQYSRVKMPIVKKIPVKKLLTECIKTAKSSFYSKKVKIVGDYSGLKNKIIEADPYQLRQVLNNILINSIEAVPERDGKIEIGVKSDKIGKKDAISITIGDNGSGISEVIGEKIFEPFFTTKTKGTGLGLAICAQIIGLHKGWIKLNNSGEKKGTSFTIMLPVKNED